MRKLFWMREGGTETAHIVEAGKTESLCGKDRQWWNAMKHKKKCECDDCVKKLDPEEFKTLCPPKA